MASSRHIVTLRKKVQEKISDIGEQRDILVAFIDEFISDNVNHAKSILAIQNNSQFMQRYLQSVQGLSRCYDTCLFLTAEAEKLIYESQEGKAFDDDEGDAIEEPPGAAAAVKSTPGPVGSNSGAIISDSVQKSHSSDAMEKVEVPTMTEKPEVPPEDSVSQNMGALEPSTLLPVHDFSNMQESFQPDKYPKTNFKPKNLCEVLEKFPSKDDTADTTCEELKINVEVKDIDIADSLKNDQEFVPYKSQRPKVDKEVFKKFLSDIVQQAERDKDKSMKEKTDQNQTPTLRDDERTVDLNSSFNIPLSSPAKNSLSVDKTKEERAPPGFDSSELTAIASLGENGTANKDPKEPLGSQEVTNDATQESLEGGCQGIAHQELPNGTLGAVIITEVHSPNQFYIQLEGTMLKCLMEEIHAYTSTNLNNLEKLSNMEEGKFCLSIFSLDMCFYRAKILKVHNEQDADVLYVDYGNKEKRNKDYLYCLPANFRHLPAQASCCALAKVVPSNKNHVWTQEDINTFCQIVAPESNQQFHCVNVHPSTEPDFPHLVDLNMYLPVPTVSYGQLCIQNTLSKVSVSTLLINQGRAKFAFLADQVATLKAIFTFRKRVTSSSNSQSKKENGATKKSEEEGTKDKKSPNKLVDSEKFQVPRPVKHSGPKPLVNTSKMKAAKNLKSKIEAKKASNPEAILLNIQTNITKESHPKAGESSEGTEVSANILNRPNSDDSLDANGYKMQIANDMKATTQTTTPDKRTIPDILPDMNITPETITTSEKTTPLTITSSEITPPVSVPSSGQELKGCVSVKNTRQNFPKFPSEKDPEVPVGKNCTALAGNKKEQYSEEFTKGSNNSLSVNSLNGSSNDLSDKVCKESASLRESKSNFSENSFRGSSIKLDDTNDINGNCSQLSSPSKGRVSLRSSHRDSDSESRVSEKSNISTPVSGQFTSGNKEIERLLVELPVKKELNIPAMLKSEDQFSTLSSESGFVGTSKENILSVSGSPPATEPINIDMCSKAFNVVLSHVRSPSLFYVHILSETIGKTLDNLMKHLNYKFEHMSKKHLKKWNSTFTPKVNDLCCAKYSGDNGFYRAVIVALQDSVATTDSPSKPGSVSKVQVFYLDFGDIEWLPKRMVYPLPKEFRDTPPLAISCSLAYLKPLVVGDEKDPTGTNWSSEAFVAFVDSTGFEDTLQMVVVSGNLVLDMVNNPSCNMHQEAQLKVFLTKMMAEEEGDVCINMELITQGHALLDAPYTTEGENVETVGHWDPMAEDYLSIRNSYHINTDDPGIASIGYSSKDERNICRFYQEGTCWKGDQCNYRHIMVSSESGRITEDQNPVFACADEFHFEEVMPEPGTFVPVEISTILNPGHFYLMLPWGKSPLEEIYDNRATGEETAEQQLFKLMQEMQEHYNTHSFNRKSLVPFAEGEIVACKFVKDGQWYRAKVLVSDDHSYQVFYVDFGNKGWVDERYVRQIEPEFLNFPFQAIECFLSDIEPLGNNSKYSHAAIKKFREMVEDVTLVAYVKSRSWSGCLWVDLYDTSEEEDVSVAGTLVSLGLAQKPSSVDGSSISSRAVSSCTSYESLVLLPG